MECLRILVQDIVVFPAHLDIVMRHLPEPVQITKELILQHQLEHRFMRQPAGTVTSAGYSGKAGNLIIINHGNGLLTYYMHCNTIFVSAGQKVSKGQNIGQVGTTGNSTGPHLHFQVMNNGRPVNPMNYL